jgi:hypothetical protein
MSAIRTVFTIATLSLTGYIAYKFKTDPEFPEKFNNKADEIYNSIFNKEVVIEETETEPEKNQVLEPEHKEVLIIKDKDTILVKQQNGIVWAKKGSLNTIYRIEYNKETEKYELKYLTETTKDELAKKIFMSRVTSKKSNKIEFPFVTIES